MDLTLFLISFLRFAAGLAASGNQDAVDLQSTPASLIIGKQSGEIWRCDYYNPTRCELFHKLSSSWARFTLVHGHHLFAGLFDGNLLRCEWYNKTSCIVFSLTDAVTSVTSIVSLAVAGGYIYAGYHNGKLLKCELNDPQNCVTVYKFTDNINSLFVFEKYIYVETNYFMLNFLWNCSYDKGFHCSKVQEDRNLYNIVSVTNLGDGIIKNTRRHLFMWYNNHTSSGSFIYKKNVSLSEETWANVAVFRRRIHVLLKTGDIKTCTEYDNTWKDYRVQSKESMNDDIARSISFTYAVRHMQSGWERVSCRGQRLPLAAFGEEQRGLAEVRVAGERLVDARGAEVDAPRAVFAMGLDGQIVHVPSLLAGAPVAGAGEMRVRRGVVQRIAACSAHYWPDVSLNRQVVDELYRRGYAGADDIILEECDYKCDVHLDL